MTERTSTDSPGLDIRCPKCGSQPGVDCIDNGEVYAPNIHIQRLVRSPNFHRLREEAEHWERDGGRGGANE